MRGKILSRNDKSYEDSTPPLEAVSFVVKGDDQREYLILSGRGYLEIDTKLRSPVDRGFLDDPQIGDEVEFEFFEYQGQFVISKIVLLKMKCE